MAQKVSVQLVSDLSGEEIKEGKGGTVSFTVENTTYELELTDKEADKFHGLFQDYISVSRKVSGGGGKKRTTVKGSASKEELAAIRKWAGENGYEVSERGRIKGEIVNAYHEAQRS